MSKIENTHVGVHQNVLPIHSWSAEEKMTHKIPEEQVCIKESKDTIDTSLKSPCGNFCIQLFYTYKISFYVVAIE